MLKFDMGNIGILQNIRKVAPKHCDNCGHKYTPDDFTVFKAQETNALVYLKCSNCGNTYVINAFVNSTGYGSQRMPLVVDLEGPEEIEKFAESEPVSKDEAIDLFTFLSSGQAENYFKTNPEKEYKDNNTLNQNLSRKSK